MTLLGMDPVRIVRARGGILRSRELREHGCSNRALAQAVKDGALVRPRNGWLAAPDADRDLVQAARAGVVITCVTQAKRLGLWVMEIPSKPHVGASANAGRVRVGRDATSGDPLAVVHWWPPLVPRAPDQLIDPIENVLDSVARCLPFEHALAIWDSALNKGMVELESLRRMPLRSRSRGVAEAATPFHDSGLETFVPLRLRWLGVRIVPQVWIHGHRVDFLIGERLVLQIDGATHVGAQRDSDIRHDAALLLLGYHVVRVGYHQIVGDWASVQDLVMRAVAQGLHLAPRARG